MTTAVIREVQVHPVAVPVSAGFHFASGTAGAAGERAGIVLVRVLDSDGCHGWGEGRPLPSWGYETPETVTAVLRHHLGPAVIGVPTSDRWQLHRRMHGAIGRGPSTGQPVAKAALDMAIHDLCSRAAGQPLRCLLGGGEERRELVLSFSVTANDPGDVREEVTRARAAGFRHFNFKLGVDGVDERGLAAAVRTRPDPARSCGLMPTRA